MVMSPDPHRCSFPALINLIIVPCSRGMSLEGWMVASPGGWSIKKKVFQLIPSTTPSPSEMSRMSAWSRRTTHARSAFLFSNRGSIAYIFISRPVIRSAVRSWCMVFSMIAVFPVRSLIVVDRSVIVTNMSLPSRSMRSTTTDISNVNLYLWVLWWVLLMSQWDEDLNDDRSFASMGWDRVAISSSPPSIIPPRAMPCQFDQFKMSPFYEFCSMSRIK